MVAVSNLGTPTKKELWEQKVFTAFAQHSGLSISGASIASCQPPMPDIRCDLDGRAYFFELAEIVPEKQAEALGTKGLYSSGFPDPDERGPHAMVHIIKQKQAKTYETADAPVDLLLYFNKDFPMYLPDVTPDGDGPTAIDRAAEECKQLGPFSRIWTYCSWTNDVKRLA